MEPQVAPQPQAPPVPPAPPTPQIKSSLLVIMSVLLIIAVAIAGLFYFQIQKLSKELSKYQTQPSPTPTTTSDPTANWKTYTDKEFEYSLKYPTGPEYVQETCGPDFMNIFMLENIEGKDSSTHSTKLCVPRGSYASFELQPAKGVFAKNEYPTTIPGREVTSEPIIIDGVEGRKYTIIRTKDAPIPEKTYEVYVEHNGYRYHFVFIDFKHEYLFTQILSTFKFLETSPSASPTPSPTF